MKTVQNDNGENPGDSLLISVEISAPPLAGINANFVSGNEFLKVAKDIFQMYCITVDVGRPYHQQSQGKVEQANGEAKAAIEAAQIE